VDNGNETDVFMSVQWCQQTARVNHIKHNQLRSVEFRSPVICSADDALVIKANTTHELLVTLKYPQTGTTVDVPQSITHTHATY